MLGPTDIFAGPILRRASPKGVAIWIAMTKSVELDGRVRKVGGDWIGEAGSVDRIKVFDTLYVYLVQVTPTEGTLPTGTLLEYQLGTVGPDGVTDWSWFDALVASDGLAYKEFALPSFYLQASGAKLTVVYLSCRKPHDVVAGANDAFSYGESLSANNAKVFAARPTILCLTGDQIYADDVHDVTFDAITAIAATLEGSKPEKLPGGLTAPGKGARQKWMEEKAKFTSGEAENHLVTFAEYVAHYGVAWNVRNWPSAVAGDVASYVSALPAVRRFMANTPTYMIFDDHDVTDDWNLGLNWRDDVKASAVGSRVIANALTAYWLFQAWGNDPAASSGEVAQMRTALAERATAPDGPGQVVGTKSTLNRWEFATPTVPAVYFLDTRTNRGHLQGFAKVDGRAPAFLKSVDSWLSTRKRLDQVIASQGRSVPLVLVATGPVFGYATIDGPQRTISGQIGPTTFDLEGWAANQPHLLLFLTLCADLDVVLLSGDVHYAFTSTATFSVFDGQFVRDAVAKMPGLRLPKSGVGSSPTFAFLYQSRFLQLNSSAARNSTGAAWKAAVMSGMASAAGENGFLLKGPKMTPSKARFKNGKLYRWQQVGPLRGAWSEVSPADAEPNFVIQQRINDPTNSTFLLEHNIGVASFSGRQVDNGFLVGGKLVSTKRWDFASGAAWVPNEPP